MFVLWLVFSSLAKSVLIHLFPSPHNFLNSKKAQENREGSVPIIKMSSKLQVVFLRNSVK